MGYCAGYPHPGYAAPARPMGWGGRGRGYRHMYYATGLPAWARPAYGPATPVAPTKEQEMQELREYARELKAEMEAIEEQIEELEADGDDE